MVPVLDSYPTDCDGAEWSVAYVPLSHTA